MPPPSDAVAEAPLQAGPAIEPSRPPARRRWPPHLGGGWPRMRLTWEEAFYLALLAVALGMRLWGLGGRAIHYDESLHVQYAYNYAQGQGYAHSAMMHGPLKFHLAALSFKLFGDSDYTARLPFALFGAAMAVLPYLFRQHLGRAGAMVVAAMLAFSPSMLYLSRYARDDILMVFWTLALVILAWRYMHEGRDRYLYLASGVLAFAFATMESAWMVAGLLGILLFLLGLPQIVPWAAGRLKMSQLTGPAGFLVLIVTLTLPQWMPIFGLVQDAMGVVLVNMDGSKGPYGHPQGAGLYVAGGLLAFAMVVSIYAGVSWKGRRWLICAAIFYAIWVTLYTSVFTNWGGVLSGVWESMGYWLAQHEVGRGGQPWYFYLALATTYEFLPFLFALPALVFYTLRGDVFGLFLAAWAILTFAIFTWAGEKMPWLIVQVALPFILLSGKFLGDLVQAICWRRSRFVGWRVLLAPLTAAALGLGVWLLYLYLDRGELNPYMWALLGGVAALCVAMLVLGHLARRRWGLALMGLGVATLLFGFGVFVAGRVNYSYKDSPVELLVYAQGSVDLRKASEDVREAVAKAAPGGEIAVDYELWYPYQWYGRHDKNVRFTCYKDRSEDGWQSYCSPLREAPAAAAVLMITSHANR
ncbi:MAG: TIGR03663 family protein, partial [Chloroflexota bacterium]|nr:TIGR03663 family protein [Chloroflexota bacterium]